MPQISKQKRDKIQEQILAYLFSISPESAFTNKIASEVIRDEEFTKALLLDLEKQSFVTKITKSPQGISYSQRQRWRLSNKAYEAYKSLKS